MNNKLASLFAITGLVFAATQVQADSLVNGSIEDGKAKSLTCTACHGPEGNSANALWPNIAGQNAPYLLAQLHAFQGGTRGSHPQDRTGKQMRAMAAVLPDDQAIAAVVAYIQTLHP